MMESLQIKCANAILSTCNLIKNVCYAENEIKYIGVKLKCNLFSSSLKYTYFPYALNIKFNELCARIN